jgi:hypothetical protein
LEAFVRWSAHRAIELDDRSIVAIAERRNLRRADRDFQSLDDRGLNAMNRNCDPP